MLTDTFFQFIYEAIGPALITVWIVGLCISSMLLIRRARLLQD